jgi:A nuclease family of the HNH/ENDO VII superfamily with conserved AHH
MWALIHNISTITSPINDMELSEPVMLAADMAEEPLCKGPEEPEKRGWQCRVGKSGSPGDLPDPSASRLHDNMKSTGVFLPSDPPKKDGDWDLEQCTKTAFPFQSHHLIPKMHLPKHDVCVWLALKAANKQWKLTESTNYDTDDAKNGMALPFASNTYQWKHSSNPLEQTRICNAMMQQTGKQLHQGSHTYIDYGEEDLLHQVEGKGYLGAVDKLLEVIHGETMNHVTSCPDCKKTASQPFEVRPLERVVASMHRASHYMGKIIEEGKRFVSKKAAAYRAP